MDTALILFLISIGCFILWFIISPPKIKIFRRGYHSVEFIPIIYEGFTFYTYPMNSTEEEIIEWINDTWRVAKLEAYRNYLKNVNKIHVNDVVYKAIDKRIAVLINMGLSQD